MVIQIAGSGGIGGEIEFRGEVQSEFRGYTLVRSVSKNVPDIFV
jgi:hypothetical protein